jgi:hypothetical protein
MPAVLAMSVQRAIEILMGPTYFDQRTDALNELDDSLDVAWAEAKAALTDQFANGHLTLSANMSGLATVSYSAVIVGPYPEMPLEGGHSFSSPAAALRELTEHLQSVP